MIWLLRRAYRRHKSAPLTRLLGNELGRFFFMEMKICQLNKWTEGYHFWQCVHPVVRLSYSRSNEVRKLWSTFTSAFLPKQCNVISKNTILVVLLRNGTNNLVFFINIWRHKSVLEFQLKCLSLSLTILFTPLWICFPLMWNLTNFSPEVLSIISTKLIIACQVYYCLWRNWTPYRAFLCINYSPCNFNW